jgi:hypothetical protein
MRYENKGILWQAIASTHGLDWSAASGDVSRVDAGEKCFGFNWETGGN